MEVDCHTWLAQHTRSTAQRGSGGGPTVKLLPCATPLHTNQQDPKHLGLTWPQMALRPRARARWDVGDESTRGGQRLFLLCAAATARRCWPRQGDAVMVWVCSTRF